MKTQFEQLEICISAPRQMIWEVVSDLNNFYLWNSVVPDGDGILEQGNRLMVSLKTTDIARRTSCHVNEVSPLHHFLLSRKLLFKWLLYLEHAFIILPVNESKNEYKFVQTLEASGLLGGVLKDPLQRRWKKFHQMNRDLKHYIHKKQHHGTTKGLEINSEKL